jgi:hypothetical protein
MILFFARVVIAWKRSASAAASLVGVVLLKY